MHSINNIEREESSKSLNFDSLTLPVVLDLALPLELDDSIV